MKAVIQNAYGAPEQVLEMREIADPPAPTGTDVLIAVRAASVHAGDYFLAMGDPWLARFAVGIPRPRTDYVVGLDLAGVVEAVGDDVTRFKPGDAVFAESTPGKVGLGACAERIIVTQDHVAAKPESLTFEQAAALPVSALAALHGLRDAGKLQPDQHVLVVGAAGGVGTYAVQLAKWMGATVTGVCSTANAELVRSLGADEVIDYAIRDYADEGPRFDLILDNVGDHSLSAARKALKPNGVLLPNSGRAGLGYFAAAAIIAPFVRQQGAPFVSNPNRDDLELLAQLAHSECIRPVIGRVFPFEQTPAALAHVGTGHAVGKTVITVAE